MLKVSGRHNYYKPKITITFSLAFGNIPCKSIKQWVCIAYLWKVDETSALRPVSDELPQLSSLQNAVLGSVSDEPPLSSNHQSSAARNRGAAQELVQLTQFY